MDQLSTNYGARLSPREKEILALLAEGMSTKEIAAKLFLSIHTVNNHRKNMLMKVGAKSSAELVFRHMNKENS